MGENKTVGLGYIAGNSAIHRLTGTTKLLMAILSSIAAMITYDTRFLVAMIVGAAIIFKISNIKMKDIRVILIFIVILMVINSIMIFIFSPEEGVKIYGTRHEIAHIVGNYYITQEQLFYMLNVILKYFSVLPMALVFIFTTDPSEFASSLNNLGVGYEISYSVALALRYIPDVIRDFTNISQAQQARGIDTSKKAKIIQRIKNISGIMFPLVFSSLSRVEIISNAMELRGFGKKKKRTWYAQKKVRNEDYVSVFICLLLIVCSIYLNFLNGGRFYNPFK